MARGKSRGWIWWNARPIMIHNNSMTNEEDPEMPFPYRLSWNRFLLCVCVCVCVCVIPINCFLFCCWFFQSFSFLSIFFFCCGAAMRPWEKWRALHNRPTFWLIGRYQRLFFLRYQTGYTLYPVFYWVLLNFIWFYMVLLDFTGFSWVGQGVVTFFLDETGGNWI